MCYNKIYKLTRGSMENKDLKYLKKYYGEKFAHLCRTLFPTLLEQEGLLSKVISKLFAPSKSLYEDVEPYQSAFSSYVMKHANFEQRKSVV